MITNNPHNSPTIGNNYPHFTDREFNGKPELKLRFV